IVFKSSLGFRKHDKTSPPRCFRINVHPTFVVLLSEHLGNMVPNESYHLFQTGNRGVPCTVYVFVKLCGAVFEGTLTLKARLAL
uniref:Uncharacterized protein n=1 Tax=Triticum urartu TaxID=4572 RepID=A0A8R7PMH0_TRIUA